MLILVWKSPQRGLLYAMIDKTIIFLQHILQDDVVTYGFRAV